MIFLVDDPGLFLAMSVGIGPGASFLVLKGWKEAQGLEAMKKDKAE